MQKFYKDPEEIRSKILGKEINEQLIVLDGIEDSYNCTDSSQLENILNEDMEADYFPSSQGDEIIPEERSLEKDTDYKIKVKSFDKAKGQAVIAIRGIGDYKGTYEFTVKLATPTLKKAANPLKVKGKASPVKYSKLRKKAQIIKRAKLIKVKGAQDKLTFKYVKAKKGKKNYTKYFKVGKKTGNVKVKKGLKKGTYKVKVKVKGAGNASYNASSWKTVIFKVKVK